MVLNFSIHLIFIYRNLSTLKTVNTNYQLSSQYGKVIQNKNWETDGRLLKYSIQTIQQNTDLETENYGDL